MDQVELRTGDLLLRPFREGDADAVFAACQDPKIQRWTTVPSPYPRESADWYVASCADFWAAETPTFACLDAGTGQLLGAFHLEDCAAEEGPLIGFWVAPEARGRGVARDVTRRLARWAFGDLGLARLRWAAYVGNTPSRRVAESAGFVIEGTARQGLVQRGVRRDAWVGSMLPSDLTRTETGRSVRVPRVEGWPSEPVELRTERLLLRATREADAPALLAYAQDPVARIWDPEDTPDLAAAVERARRRMDWSSGDVAVWTIADPEDTHIWGGIQIFDVSARSLCAETGYGLLSEARGNGYGAEALRTVTQWAFTQTELHRIALMHAVGNGASCAVATAAGYQLEGTMRQSHRYGDGRLHDEHLHARLRTDPAPPPTS